MLLHPVLVKHALWLHVEHIRILCCIWEFYSDTLPLLWNQLVVVSMFPCLVFLDIVYVIFGDEYACLTLIASGVQHCEDTPDQASPFLILGHIFKPVSRFIDRLVGELGLKLGGPAAW